MSTERPFSDAPVPPFFPRRSGRPGPPGTAQIGQPPRSHHALIMTCAVSDQARKISRGVSCSCHRARLRRADMQTVN